MFLAPVQRLLLLHGVQLERYRLQKMLLLPSCLKFKGIEEGGGEEDIDGSNPGYTRRPGLGQYERLMSELRDEDIPAFRNFVRMESAMFQELLTRVDPRITRKDVWHRKALDLGFKLAITLPHQATGDGYRTLMYGFRVAYKTISMIISDVCEAIIEAYAEEVIACPTTPPEWQQKLNSLAPDRTFSTPLGLWMASTSPSSARSPSPTTTRGSIQSSWWHWLMGTTNSFGWT